MGSSFFACVAPNADRLCKKGLPLLKWLCYGGVIRYVLTKVFSHVKVLLKLAQRLWKGEVGNGCIPKS